MKHALAVLLLAILVPATSFGQLPSDTWRTIQTDHFRVHYPADYEAWATYATARLESIASAVADEVGFSPSDQIDIIIQDPIARPNGSAWPFLGFPRMVLWTSPPSPDSVIGYYNDWAELLLIHEQTHLAHLLRPSRNPLQKLMERFLPAGPIALNAPRWVTEGYATVIEGKLTGTGRPQSEIRSAILREWARNGRLPSYSQLSSDSRTWLGQSMAYLVGSAYLEWLRDRAGEESYRNLWRRMTARESRSFDEAFRGVYGDSPHRLYGRFTAELTHDAIEIERTIETENGELWQDLSWTTGAPDLSPSGDRLVIVLRSRDEPARLVVWSTAVDTEENEKYEKRIEKLLEKDADDVAPVRTKPLRRKPLHEIEAKNGADFYAPRWMPDGGSILFHSFEPDADGFLRADLFRWWPHNGRLMRVTRGSDVRQPAPLADGRSAVAVRNRFGFSNLVRVDLETGAVNMLTDEPVGVATSDPAVSPDGSKIAFVRHASGSWRLTIRDAYTDTTSELNLPPGATTVAHPEWVSSDRLYAAIGVDGLIEIWELGEDTAPVPVTRSPGASVHPTSAGGDLFFLALDVDGWDLRRLHLSDWTPPAALTASPSLARPVLDRPLPRLVVEDLPEPSPYGIGRQEWSLLSGGVYAPSGHALEAGIRVGDVVGRLDTILLGSFGTKGGVDGMALMSRWRGWPVEIGAHLYDFDEAISEQSEPIGASFDSKRRGIEVDASWDRAWRGARLSIEGGMLIGRVDRRGATDDQQVYFAKTDLMKNIDFGSIEVELSISGSSAVGKTGDDSWNAPRGLVRLGVGSDDTKIRIGWQRSSVNGAESAADRILVGGLYGSVVPKGLLVNRAVASALPVASLVGEHYERQSVAIDTSSIPLRPFFERHRAWDDENDETLWVEIAGLEWSASIDSFPLLKLPGASVRLGIARILDGPIEESTEWWLGLTWRP